MDSTSNDYPDMNTLEISKNSFDGKFVELNIDDDLTDEQYREYYAAEVKSEGFDVPHYPNIAIPGMIQPIKNLARFKEEFDLYGGLAIKQYNEQNGTNFEIVELVKLNVATAAGFLFYMTFKAKPSGTPADHPTTTFQAKVFAGIEETELDFCRGFEVPHYPNIPVPGIIEAYILNLARFKEDFDLYGGLAIKQYNEQNGTNFEFVERVKLNAA